jgi:hypothetical protein
LVEAVALDDVVGQSAANASALEQLQRLAELTTVQSHPEPVTASDDDDFGQDEDVAVFAEIPAKPKPRVPTTSRPALPPVPVVTRPTVDPQATLAEGIRLVSAAVPEWRERNNADRVFGVVRDNPAAFAQSLSTGDPSSVARSLANTLQTVQTGDQLHAMKLAAQSLSGTSGRPSAPSGDDAVWERIRSAGADTYSDRMKRS